MQFWLHDCIQFLIGFLRPCGNISKSATVSARHPLDSIRVQFEMVAKENEMKMKLAALLVVVVPLGLGAGAAFADTATFTLSQGNVAVTGTGPYVTVTVNRSDSTHAAITFDSLTNGGNVYLMGDGGSVGINVNAATWTLSGVTGSNAFTGFSPGPWSDGGSGTEDGFGTFKQTVNSFDGFMNTSSEIVVSLVNTGGTWANAASVLTANASGNALVAHVFACSVTCNEANGALFTGFVTTAAPAVTPEPGTLALFGSGLIGVAGILRRRFAR